MGFSTTAAEICSMLGGELIGSGDTALNGVGSVDDASIGDIVLAENGKYLKQAVSSNATCIVCGADMAKDCDGKVVIAVDRPGEAFAKVLELFRGDEWLPAIGIAPGATVESDATLGNDVAIGANCYVGHGAVLGDGCVLFPNVFVGPGVIVGDGTKLYQGASIYADCMVGKRVILHAGVVIGADGFGYRPGRAGLMKLAHAGDVVIGDDVEIGANSAVDRAKTGSTIIGRGTKIDNLVHIAHNVKIGEHCVVVALSGVAGSVEIGNGVTLAAQSGVRDHVKIEDGAVVAARSGVIGNVSKGMTVSGFPARDHKEDMRVQAVASRLPDVLERLRALEREVKQLREGSEK